MRVLSLLVAFLSAAQVAASSGKDDGCLLPNYPDDLSTKKKDREQEYCFDLVGDLGDQFKVGELCVTGNEETDLKIHVQAGQGYTLVKNHVWVGTDIADLPLKAGGVDLAAFPERACNSDAELTEAKWTIHKKSNPCSEASEETLNFVVVAQSIVEDSDGRQMTVHAAEYPADDVSPVPWMDVTLFCECYQKKMLRTRGGIA